MTHVGIMLKALEMDCKGEGCSEEETSEVMRAFLQPLVNYVNEMYQKDKATKEFEEACTLE
jgi:ATP-dependent RNA circularization protein (DNA/RNA ligase family)